MSIDVEELLETFPEEARQAWRDKTNWKQSDQDLIPSWMCTKYPWKDEDHDEDDDGGWRLTVIRYRWVIKRGNLSLKVWHLECHDTDGYNTQSFSEAEEPPDTVNPADFEDVDALYKSVDEEAESKWQTYYKWVTENKSNPLEARLPKDIEAALIA